MVGKIQNPPIPMGGFCFIFEHINIFFNREILWNIIIAIVSAWVLCGEGFGGSLAA